MQTPNIMTEKKRVCCGCASCESICPTNAITMITDEEGFFYPEIEPEKCTSCGLCSRVCAFKQKDASNTLSTIIAQYAIKYRRNAIRSQSQSGGAFVALAVYLIEHYAEVSIYGASFYDVYKVHHVAIHSTDNIGRLQGSKYIQSDMLGVYKEIASDLKIGRVVMFSGTPCQNHAVKQYLSVKNVDSKNLYLMDFICEGVGSPYVWEQYIQLIEKKFKGNVTKVVFRDKRHGWIRHFETMELNGYSRTIVGRIWTNLFYDKLFFRESCHNCRYTSQNRESDITVCWFGNIHKKYPDFDDGNGVSGIMINTHKGKNWFESLKNELDVIPVTMDEIMQQQLQHPIDVSPRRKTFWDDFTNKDKWLVMKKYNAATFKTRLKRLIKNCIQKDWKWL